ncbi:MAG TPA: HAMP domain-containing sensor histidine kinase [Nitrososphaeraceae archaeon]|nr:HAMP domain-containing sensor histidine kinase [Nitrososphaeraceae archaeon]
MNTVLQFLYQSSNVIDACVDYTRPSLAVDILVLRKAFLAARSKGVKLRYVTEITDENIHYCKQLLTMVDELRHLDGIKGNFYITETAYIAPATFHEKGEPAAQIIYSNVREVVEHQLYVFDSFWSRAIPAEERIREIQEGKVRYQTRIIENPDEIIRQISRLTASSNELSTCLSSGGLHYSHKYFFDIKKKLLDKQKKGEHKGIRYITNIDNENVELAKLYLDSGIQIKHVKNLPPMSFGVSDKEMAVTIEKMEGGRVINSLLSSNEPLYVKHFASIFEELWRNGIDAKSRIRDIDEGIETEGIDIIRNPTESLKIAYDIVKSARHEVLRIYPSINALRRQIRAGAFRIFKEVLEDGVKVRILIPADEQQIAELESEITLVLPQLEIRSIDKSLQTSIGIIVVDRKKSLIIESRDDTKDNYYDAVGLAAYSNSRPIALSYASVFETLWKQAELYKQINFYYEQLKIHNKMQEEFINVAAHELRTPIQPVLSLSELLLSKKGDIEQYEEILESINRNGKRLQRLAENILDVTKIESQSLQLKKEKFILNDLILSIFTNYESHMKKAEISNVKLAMAPKEDIVLVEGDKERLTQVFDNILSNAIKFTKEGRITVSIERMKENDKEFGVVSVKDTGSGIDSEILPRLFTKFATKSQTGTGLGLYISKRIIETHGGKVWAENNLQETGATFSFSIALD